MKKLVRNQVTCYAESTRGVNMRTTNYVLMIFMHDQIARGTQEPRHNSHTWTQVTILAGPRLPTIQLA